MNQKMTIDNSNLQSLFLAGTKIGLVSSALRLTRNAVSISEKLFAVPACISKISAMTHFIFVLKLPLSIYRLKINAEKQFCNLSGRAKSFYALELFGKIGMVSNDSLHIVKGLKATEWIDGKTIFMFAKSKIALFLGSGFMLSRLAGSWIALRQSEKTLKNQTKRLCVNFAKTSRILNCRIKSHQLALISAIIDSIAITILSLSGYLIFGNILFAISSIVSIKRHSENFNNSKLSN